MEQPPDRQNRPWRFSTFVYSSSISFLLLSILTLSFTTTDLYKTQTLRFTTYLQPLFSKSKPASPPSHCVLWMAPFLSSGGYSSEAWSYILSLHHHNLQNPKFRITIEHHGDLQSPEFWNGLAKETRELAIEMHETECRPNETIVVCHSEPGAWYPPLFETLPCPPPYGYGDFRAVIGRTMFETDRVNGEHVERCNKMDRVWVPSEFHVSSFVGSGVDSSKVVKIVQPVDVDVFDPLKEFSGKDNVALFLLTNAYHSDRDFGNKIVDFVKELDLEEGEGGYPFVYVIDKHIAQVDLPRLYKAADAFVLPTRGEGWGRPIVEAMAMSLPVIATNWSGPTEYLTEENGYPLVVEEMSEVKEGPFEGHRWAEPSVGKLRVLMRRVVSEPDEAKVKGKRGREDMVKKFAPEVVAKVVAEQIERIFEEKTRT
ncbi:UDP-Glycosyltransferase superfamily protein [Raphanus sativus]|nr:UDP-Glycosyltransferase superfamily protein [Raphanus sativus]